MADLDTILSRQTWAAVPFHFWTAVFFVLGSMVGSLLNVCIHRMPIGESIVRPPSHCPHCKYSIPWFLNIPLITWLYLRGKCANCRAPISIRYFLVELLTGVVFTGCWLRFGRESVLVALIACLIVSGFIVATFIDLEHLIIPDEITIGGAVAGFLCSAAVPLLHGTLDRPEAMRASFWGILIGGGGVYLVLRLGKLAFGKQKVDLPPESRLIFTETALKLPDKDIPYEDLFYRKTDFIQFTARQVELPDRCYFNTVVRLTPEELMIGDEKMNPEQVPHMEALGSDLVLPREAMGFGDVKFMAAIGAFMGWAGATFAFMFSACLGALVGIVSIAAGKREWSARIPFGPYIVAAATFWLFAPAGVHTWWRDYISVLKHFVTGSPPV